MGLEKISEYKKALGLTNEELANKAGVPKGTLDKILSGVTKDPTLGTLKSLARVLNCSLDDFDDSNTTNVYSSKETQLLDRFNKLNDIGKDEAIKRVSELSEIPKYSNENIPTTLAAHNSSNDPEANKRDLEKLKEVINNKNK